MINQWQPRVLREYSLIADGDRGALIAPDGAMGWLCMPRWDSPAVFSALLGGPGGYAITPADPRYVWGGYYRPGTLIWRSRWVANGVTECREALAMPASPHSAVLLRRVEAVDGPARLQVTLDVRARFGRQPTVDLRRSRGRWTGRSGNIRLRWSGAARARPDADGRLSMTLNLPAGSHHDFMLELTDQPLGDRPAAWSSVVPDCSGLIAVRDARHAYAVLRGLSASSGGMVAAATTSIPERMDSFRNYDYRYAWIRDQCYAGLAVAAHGQHPLLAGALQFITQRLHNDGPDLKPAYTVSGGRVPDERGLRLAGYPGAKVRIGNRVNEQFQLAFLLCGFWMAQAASIRGDHVAAAHWFERSRSARGPAGLYTEEYDVHQRQQRGNLPQAFVHAGMLRTAVHLSQTKAAGVDLTAR